MLPRRIISLLVVSVLSGASGVARAEGPGIRLGDRLVLHLGIATEFRYDSNVFFDDTNRVQAGLFRALPSLDLATRPASREHNVRHTVDFRLHAGLDYSEFLTSDPSLSRYRGIGVQGAALLSLFPGRQLSLDLFDNYTRTFQQPYAQGSRQINRHTNGLGLRLRYRPQGGRLELNLQYAFNLDLFEDAPYTDLDVFYHAITFLASWKFLPKTAIYLSVSETPTLYPHRGVTNHPDAYPLRIVAGLRGLITPKLTTHLWIGYQNGFYSGPVNTNTPIGGLQLQWRPFASSNASIGYEHTAANSLLGSYYDLDRATASWTQQIWRVSGSVLFNYSSVRYKGVVTDVTGVLPGMNRNDHVIQLEARLAYHFRDWLNIAVGYHLQYNNSDSRLNGGPLGLLPLDYTKHEAYLRLSVLY